MERKTLLAIALSFLFLIAYNSLVIAPQQKVKSPEKLQTVENNTVELKLESPSIDFVESDKFIEIGSFKIRFSPDLGIIKEIFSKTHNYAPILGSFLDLTKSAKFNSYSNDPTSLTLVFDQDGLQIEQVLKAIDSERLTILIRYIGNPTSQNPTFNLFDLNGHRIKEDKNKMRDSMLLEYSYLVDNKVFRKNNAFKFSEKEVKREEKRVEWFGWRDRYHFSILEPKFDLKNYSILWIDDHTIRFEATPSNSNSEFLFNFYLGPQDLDLLQKLDGNLDKIMAFSGNGILDAIEKFIYKTLLVMNKYIKNWGVSIILISVLIYGLTYPLTFKSMMSMRKMQELQPKMAELREKYKNDPQKLNTEVVQLYRVHNVNPLAGCLPMLLQMPVFISLYQVLWRTHNFQGAKFLWIQDLSIPDRLFVFSSSFPFIGNELNILPFVMTVVMFFQQKLSSKNMVVTDPSQEMQQKMMMYIFPVFIGGIFYHFASGLTLYFTVFYLLSTLTQYKMSKLTVPVK